MLRRKKAEQVIGLLGDAEAQGTLDELAPGLLRAVFEACCEAEEEGADEDEPSLHRYAAQVLESLSEALPSKHLMPTLMEIVAAAPAETRRHRAAAQAVSEESAGERRVDLQAVRTVLPLDARGRGGVPAEAKRGIRFRVRQKRRGGKVRRAGQQQLAVP